MREMTTEDVIGALAAAVISEIQGELADGLASVTVEQRHGDPHILVEPARSDAAPLEVQIDGPKQVTVYPGRNGLSVERWDDLDELTDFARELARATARGEYSEVVPRDPSEKARGVGTWPEAGRIHEARVNVWRRPKAGDRKWQQIDYAPYRR